MPRRPGSLRRQIPLALASLVTLVAVTIVWAAHREVEKTLVVAGQERAAAATQEIAGMLSASMRGLVAQLHRLQQNPDVLGVLHNPTEQTRQKAGDVLARSGASSSARKYEVWSADGVRLVERLLPRSSPAGIREFSEEPPPHASGISPLKAAGRFAYFTVTLELHENGRLVGYVRRFAEFTTAGPLKQLLGDDAHLKIGSADGLWSDFETVVPPPPRPSPAGSHVDETGAAWVGYLRSVGETPWSLWVGYPRPSTVAPAHSFLRRMLWIGAGIVVLGALVARVVAARITRPLVEMSDAASDVAAGNFDKRVDASRRDEIGVLATAFNSMTAQLASDAARRHAAEQALREREESFRTLFENNPLPMWVYDRETLRFLEVNDAAVTHYGYSRDEFLSLTIADIRPPEDVPRLLTDLASRRGPLSRSEGWRHRLKSGKVIHVEVSSHTLPYGGREAVLVVAQDVTERQRLEAQFLQAQKMEAIGQLTGGVAHDFNNLLTAILGYADLLSDAIPEGDPRRADVEEIRKAGVSAAALTSRLLSFSRKQIVEPEILDPNVLITDTARMLKRVATEEITVRLDLAPRVGKVKADASQLQQVLLNLVVNARDAMPTGGVVTIHSENVRLDAQYVGTHFDTPSGEYVMLAVSDTGHGMAPEVKARLFEPFFTTKEPGKGTGLGLASVYGIVKQSGGNIFVYSEPGRGTTFKIYLPQVEAESDARTAATAAQVEPTHATILIVEDQPEILALTRRILQSAGFAVLAAGSAAEALEIAAAAHEPIDLLLTDVVMPQQSGPALAQTLLERQPHMRILYMSGYAADGAVRAGVLNSAALVQKPFSPDGLLEKIRSVLAGRDGPAST